MPNTPIEYVQDLADMYCASRGMGAPKRGLYATKDKHAEDIALAYGQLQKFSDNKVVRYAYEELAEEVEAQWDFCLDHGIAFEPWTSEGQPYANSPEMCEDVRLHRHLYYFTGGEEHPFLKENNDKFRAIHDFFGHAAEGYQFGPRGEFNAWIKHSQMFSPLAQWAMTTETRGQNSWVNFGPHRHLPAKDRPFAKQKVDLLPTEYTDYKHFLGGYNE